MTKFCKDCKFSTGRNTFAKCLHPDSYMGVDADYLVSGWGKKRSYRYCTTQRGEYGKCKTEAVNFEQRIFFLDRFLNWLERKTTRGHDNV